MGDDILLVSLLRGLRKKFPGGHFVLFSADCRKTRRLLEQEGFPLSVVDCIYSGRWGFREKQKSFVPSFYWFFRTFTWLKRSDLFIVGPGNPILDHTNRFKVVFYGSRAFLAWLLGTPVAYVGVGVGAVRWWFSKIFFRFIGNRAVFISPRDAYSGRDLKKLGIYKAPVIPLADLSFCEVNGKQYASSKF